VKNGSSFTYNSKKIVSTNDNRIIFKWQYNLQQHSSGTDRTTKLFYLIASKDTPESFLSALQSKVKTK